MTIRNRTSLSLVLVLSFTTLMSAANQTGGSPAPEQAKAQALANYSRMPLSFEENRGQAESQVKFLSRGGDYSIQLSPAEVFLTLRSQRQRHQSSIRMSFPGAQTPAVVAGSERQAGISSYFVGSDSARWVGGAPNFARVNYRDLLPGIDLSFYGNQGQLEYDFVVSPGADPKAIRLQFAGLSGIRLDGRGNLVLSTADGQIVQHKPVIYQTGAGGRETVDGRYVIQPGNRVAFDIAKYDSRRALVIDPSILFSTYLGTPGDDVFGLSQTASATSYPAVAVDSSGNIYATGYVGGVNFPGPPVILTAGGEGGGTDIFIVKMSPSGSKIYSVEMGTGLNEDIVGGIAVDSSGNAYVTGHTNSPNFPVTPGAAQSSIVSGSINAFITKVNSGGTAILYSTYLGGSGTFYGNAIAVDRSGNAYVTGTANQSTGSGTTFFPLVNPLEPVPSAGFLTEVNSGGTAWVYSTFLGPGIGYGIAVDSGSDAYVTGSTGNLLAPSPAQGYVYKINAGGSSAGYGPILLGRTSTTITLQTIGFGIALDTQNNAYVAGETNDPSFPQITGGAPQGVYGGGASDGFAIKVSSSGNVAYGTYIGGLGNNLLPERGSGIGVDAQGNAYVSGTTQCINFPVVSSLSGARNGTASVLMKGTVSGNTSNWTSTGLAGIFDQVDALAFDPSGNLYAGASAVNVTSGGGIYKLAAGGSAWSPVNSGITTTTIDAIAVDPNTPSTVYAIGSGHLYQTTNGGTSWSELALQVGTSAVMTIAKTTPASTLYIGSSAGLIYTTNPTGTWSSPNTPPAGGAILALLVNPNSPTTVYAATSQGVYETTNNSVWSAADTGIEPQPNQGPAVAVTGLAMNPTTNTIYAATGAGLYYSTNAGGNWTQVLIGSPEPLLNTPVLVTVDAGNNVYLAFQGAGMATGTSGGTQQSDWSLLTYNGLTQNQIKALVTPPTGFGSAYAGIFAATTAFMTEINSSGTSFTSSTCIGGTDNNLGQSIVVTQSGNFAVSGLTVATNFPTTSGAIQTHNAGLYDAFVLAAGIAQEQLVSPVAGFELLDTSDTFSWDPVGGATAYQLTIGTSAGATNIFSGTVTGTSQIVDFIPCTGGTIYVELSAEVNGTFQQATAYSFKCRSEVGDFNGDGSQDLLWQNSSSLQVNVNYFGGVGPQAQGSASLNNGSTLAGWKVVGAADFDGNGVPDLVLQNTSTGVVNVNYYGGSNRTTIIGSACLNCTPPADSIVVAVADMNGDGVPDLIWQNTSTNEVTVYYYGGSGGSTITGSAILSTGVGAAGWRVVAAADFDGNGTPDLVWQNQTSGQVNVDYYGGSGGTTFLGYAVLNSGAGTSGWSVVAAADWNADGVPDLVWQNNSTLQINVDYYGGAGGAVLKGWNCLDCNSFLTGGSVRAVATYSTNGEQNLIWQNSTTNAVNVYYYGLGGYIFEGWNELSTGSGMSGWKLVASADFDGNGVPDLVWQNTSTGQVNVYYYGGSGGATNTGSAVLSNGLGSGWSVVAAVDMNGDGVPDLIWQNSTSGQVNVNYYGGSGGATMIGSAVLTNGTGTAGWHVVAAADFDGNGVPDLVWQNLSSRQVNVDYYGGAGGTTLIGYAVLSSGAAGWTVVGANDYDGNGVPDLVWRNDSTGAVNVDYYGGSKGTVLKGWNVLSSAPNSAWNVVVPHER